VRRNSVSSYALPVIVRCCTEAHSRGLADAVGTLRSSPAAALGIVRSWRDFLNDPALYLRYLLSNKE